MESRKVMMNIYIRLFLLKREKQSFRLLYGYGLPDEVNEIRSWKKENWENGLAFTKRPV